MPDIEPITREEKLLDGEDLTPITRKEQFIKRIYDKTQEIPEPITREEMFLKKAGEGGGGDIDLQTLNVTENGTVNAPSGVAYNKVVTDVPQPTMTKLTATENRTYTAPSGTAYNEVDVDVPLPENAYLLKELSNLPQPIATFNDGSDNPLKSLTASIEPVQDLHGYDSPWAGGAGKNKMPLIVLSTQTKNGITFTPVYYGDSLVRIDIKGKKAISGSIWYGISDASITISQNMIMNGAQSGSNVRLAAFRVSVGSGDYIDTGDGVEIPTSAEQIVEIDIRVDGNAGTQIDTSVYPMLRYATSADDSYQPYSNICPISGWTEEVVTVADDTTTPTVEQTYTIPFTDSQGNPVEVFGGSVDVVNGTSGNEKTLGKFILDENSTIYTGSSGMPFRISIDDIKRSTSESSLLGLSSNQMKEVTQSDTWGNECTMSVIANSDRIFFKLTNDITTVADLKTYLEQHPIEIVYPLATPTTFYTQPTAVKSLDGVNNVFASTGDVEELKYFSKEAE